MAVSGTRRATMTFLAPEKAHRGDRPARRLELVTPRDHPWRLVSVEYKQGIKVTHYAREAS